MSDDSARRDFIDWLGARITDRHVLEAFARVPRECFVPVAWRGQAYADHPLPIGAGQTISQPLMVAIMTEALRPQTSDRVLEVGTGSGYQAAILARLVREVVTVERIPDLLALAEENLAAAGCTNVECHLASADQLGWPAGAPYDGIIVAAAAPAVPMSLVDQLAIGGLLVVPVGSREEQELLRVTRRDSGPQVERLGGCRFVPLIGPDAWPADDPDASDW